MSDLAIRVENLSKRYRIGGKQERYRTLRDTVTDAFASPFRRLSSVVRGQSSTETNRTIWALKDISFDVAHGEVVGIIGGNGAGKTTLLKVLSRITEPTEGFAEIRGRVGSLLEVGTGFHPELTGRENTYLNGAILGMTRVEIDRKFDEIVAFSGVERFIDTPVKHYSSGMHVRLAFSVAAHLEPEILLIDEVLAVGDAEFQKKCLGKMENAARQGRTVLFVSHNMGAVSSLCGKGLLLRGGRIQASGAIDSVVASYLQESAASGDSVSLLNHPNRAEGRRPLLTSFSMDTSGGIAEHGAPLTIRIGYDFPEEFMAPRFVVVLRSLLGVRVFTLVSAHQPNRLPSSLVGRGEAVCRIESLPLMPGRYYVSVRLWQAHKRLDDVDNVSLLQVEWLDRDLGQFNWNGSLGLVYVEAEWDWRKA
jgi:lipopolysaccharide transport system ATP-binding protein